MKYDKEKAIYELWKIIDDIDTASDVAKNNDKFYRKLVEEYQAKRHQIVEEKYIDRLYEKYYGKG